MKKRHFRDKSRDSSFHRKNSKDYASMNRMIYLWLVIGNDVTPTVRRFFPGNTLYWAVFIEKIETIGFKALHFRTSNWL